MISRIYSSSIIFLIVILPINADELIIEGDKKTLTNAESKFNIIIIRNYMIPSIYKFIFDIPKLTIHDEVFSNEKKVEWRYNFTGIPPGTYELNIKAYIYPFSNTKYGWKVAETNVMIEIRDSLDDFISIEAEQDILPSLMNNVFIFMINKIVNFSVNIDPNSILRRNTVKLDYFWELSGPGINKINFTKENFQFTFNSTGNYTINLKVSAVIQPNQMKKYGTVQSNIQIKMPISNVTVSGSTFVKNGSLLHLNITCNGSSNFLFCHDFGPTKSNESCFQSGRVLYDCNYVIMHYFRENGTKYLNIGIQNAVSTVFHNVKITIYKVTPQPSFAFVIIPLISLMLVIAIAAAGIAHYIQQRRMMNSTIEVATIENFGVYDNNETLLEKTFWRRVQDSFSEAFHNKGYFL